MVFRACSSQSNVFGLRTVRRLENRRYGRLENLRYDNALRKRIAAFPDGFWEVNMVEVMTEHVVIALPNTPAQARRADDVGLLTETRSRRCLQTVC